MSCSGNSSEERCLRIDGVGSLGEGVGRNDGGVVFVPGALPGELVRARLVQKKKSFARALLLEVLEASPERVEPPCPWFGSCGGCVLQHAAYPAQLAIKRQVVGQTLARLAGVDLAVPLPLAAAEPYAYRCRAMLHVAAGEPGLDLGFYQPGSHRLIPADKCLLLAPPLLELIALLRQVLPEAGPLLGLREISLRCSADQQRLLLTFITDAPLPALADLANQLTVTEPRLVSVWQNSGLPGYGAYGRDWALLAGAESLLDELAGVKLEVAPAAFTQVHPAQTARLYRVAAEFAQLEAGETLLDIYCGLGGVGLALAQPENRLIGIESYAPAATAAQQNAALNGRPDAAYHIGLAEEILPGLASAGSRPDAAVLDPPRAGCDPAALAALAQLGPKRIVYISCAPATLARDSKILAAQGYRIMAAQPVDMFCQTGHVETVVLMSKVEK